MIDNLIKKVKLAQQSNSKEIRLTIAEATDIIAEFALSASNQDKILKKLDTISKGSYTPTDCVSTIHINGGDF